MEEPVTDRLETVAPEHCTWVAVPVGADGLVFTVTTTGVLETLSHPLMVCEA